MKLVMTTNLGLQDAKRLGIEAEAAHEGDMIDADGAVAEELVKRGWAVAATSAATSTAAKPAPPTKPATSTDKGPAANA